MLVAGLVHFVNRALTGGIDPIVVAAAAAFGLVYIHPFEDGNGRIHRWLVHHVLAAGGLTPRELVFPVSHVIQRRISDSPPSAEPVKSGDPLNTMAIREPPSLTGFILEIIC